MTTVDWSQIDTSVPMSLAADVSSSDLFGGDLFGDELIDMYGSSNISEEPKDQDILNSISEKEGNKGTESAITKPEQPPNSDVSALDGLGAFRPVTSFNDFAELLPPSTTEGGSNTNAVPISPSIESTIMQPSELQTSSNTQLPIEKKEVYEVQKAKLGTKRKNNELSNVRVVKNHAPVIPSSLLPTGKGVKVSQILPNKWKTNKQDTPDPLGSGTEVAKTSITNTPAQTTPIPDQIPSTSQGNTVSQKQEISVSSVPVTTPVSKPKVEEPHSIPNGITQATITAAAVAAASVPPPTAADFTAVAQAAVSSLILNAGTQSTQISTSKLAGVGDASKSSDTKIVAKKSLPNTTTAHVNALTSSNWVSAVNNNNGPTTLAPATTTINPAPPIAAVESSALAPASKRRRQNLTPDERAKQNRDRNREHARNTRLRKKAYVEELKRTLTDLVTQRDASEVERRRLEQRELEQREVRFRVMEELLKLRGTCESNINRWSAIFEDEFTLTLPVTHFRKMVTPAKPDSSERCLTEQILHGAEQTKTDSNLLAAFLERVYFVEENPTSERKVSLIYDCDRKKFFMDGTTAFLNWTANTSITQSNHNYPSFQIKGMMQATFCPTSNKLTSAALSFDTNAVVANVNRVQSIIHADLASAKSVQDAAAEADAILDSLEMPYFLPSAEETNPTCATAVSVTASEKSESENEEEHAME